MPTDQQTPRRPGRPRTRPDGAKKRAFYLTDDEFARVCTRADATGISVESWVRLMVLDAVKRKR